MAVTQFKIEFASMLSFLAVVECKKDADYALVTYTEVLNDPGVFRTTISYVNDTNHNGMVDGDDQRCLYEISIPGNPESLNVGQAHAFDLVIGGGSGSTGATAVSQAVATSVANGDPVTGFELSYQDQTFLSATDLPPISWNDFLNSIILNANFDQTYQNLVSLLDDDTTATGSDGPTASRLAPATIP